MKETRFALLFMQCLIFLSIGIHAQNNNYSELIQECEDFIIQKMKSDHIVGVSAAIIVDDTVIWKNGFGYADKENNVTMTANTVVNIASVTKTFTALAIMQLHEKGIIDINQPVTQYLPRFDPKTRGENLEKLTIQSVITHSSGIQSDILKNSDLGSGVYTDVLNYINETYLLYPPGLVESYSNSGYNILGHLIKEVSKQDYPEYIRNNIFTPLGMSHSGFIMDSLKNRTSVYSEMKRLTEYAFRDIASGGIYTDINDLTKYAKGLLDAYHGKNASLVQTTTIHDMFTLQRDHVLIESNKKGLGWFMFKNDSIFAVTHAGDGAFGHAELCLIPEKNAAVMILINSAEGEPLRREFCFQFLNKFGLSVPDIIPPPVIKEVHKDINPVVLSHDILMKHAGDYSPGFSYLTVSVEDSHLIMDRDNKYTLLKPLSENEFVPYEITKTGETVLKEDERYCFMDFDNFHILLYKAGNSESQLGYRLNPLNTSTMSKKLGEYEHFGYQPLVSDTKFNGADLSLAENRVLLLKLLTSDGEYTFTLNVISDTCAVTSGLGTGFGYTIKFTENEEFNILDFGGITFRKRNLNSSR